MRLLVSLALVTATLLVAQSARISTVEPQSAKAGDVCTAAGENLDKEHVKELYLTDGKNDFKVEIVEQTAAALKFKVPATAAAKGRLALMITTAGKAPQMIEQPVKVTIE